MNKLTPCFLVGAENEASPHLSFILEALSGVFAMPGRQNNSAFHEPLADDFVFSLRNPFHSEISIHELTTPKNPVSKNLFLITSEERKAQGHQADTPRRHGDSEKEQERKQKNLLNICPDL